MIVVMAWTSITKRELGYAFFLSAGALLTGVLIANGAYLMRTAPPVATMGVLSGVLPSMTFASSRFWLPRTQLTDEQVWRVAAWGGLGIGLLTMVDVGILLVHTYAQPLISLGLFSLMGHVAIGGVVGVLAGTAWELNSNARSFHEQNSVMNRILRHNLRNDINVIQGSAKLIRDGKGDPVAHAERIAARVNELMKVSEQVRRIQETNDPNRLAPTPIDVATLVAERLEVIQRAHPEVSVRERLPEEALAFADQLLEAVIDNLLENAVEHNDGEVVVTVCVERNPVEGTVIIEVADNGPGIPESELTVLNGGRETQLHHSTGTGLWLVKWYVEQNEGELSIDSSAEGTRIRIGLPSADTDAPGRNPVAWARWFVRLTRI